MRSEEIQPNKKIHRICKNFPVNSSEHFENVIKPFLKQGNNPYFRKIQVNWEKIIGSLAHDFTSRQKLIKCTRPKSIINIGNRNKIKNALIIETCSPSESQKLHARKSILIEVIALILGSKLIEEIKFEINPELQTELDEYIRSFDNLKSLLSEDEINNIISTVGHQENEEARQALIKLGISLKAREKKVSASKNKLKDLL